MALNREQFEKKAASVQREFDFVILPSDGEVVKVQSLTRSEQRKWRKSCQKKNGDTDPQKQGYFDDVLLSMSVVDDDNLQVYTVSEAFDGCWDAFAMRDTNAILQAVSKLNNLGGVETESVDATLKNSDATPGNGTAGVSAEDTE